MKQTYPILLLFCSLLLVSCSSDDEATDSFTATSSFQITENGGTETFTYNSNDNLIFCRTLSNGELWIRLAESQSNDGADSPHIDIDVCNYAGSGTYTPTDPESRPCPEGLLFDIWWHGDSKIYNNELNSANCELILTLEGDILSGVFSCEDVSEFQGTETIMIKEGSFTCKVTN